MKFCDDRIQKHLLNGGKIKRKIKTKDTIIHIGDFGYFYDDKNFYNFSITDLTVDDWEIVKPEYDWDKIIKDKVLCQFWNELEETDEPYVGYLTKKTAEEFYRNGCNCGWKFCKPFNPAEFNIAKDLKEYEK